MGGPERPPPPLGVIDEVNTLGLKVTVLKTAMELDVFTTIASGCQHLEEIAQATCCSLGGMRALLDALCPVGRGVMRSNSAREYPALAVWITSIITLLSMSHRIHSIEQAPYQAIESLQRDTTCLLVTVSDGHQSTIGSKFIDNSRGRPTRATITRDDELDNAGYQCDCRHHHTHTMYTPVWSVPAHCWPLIPPRPCQDLSHHK